jgi:hypothetical protein
MVGRRENKRGKGGRGENKGGRRRIGEIYLGDRG